MIFQPLNVSTTQKSTANQLYFNKKIYVKKINCKLKSEIRHNDAGAAKENNLPIKGRRSSLGLEYFALSYVLSRHDL